MVYVVVVGLDVNNGDARDLCDNIEDETFNTEKEFNDRLTACGVEPEYMPSEGHEDGVQFYALTDYMELVNDQVLDCLTGSFISYVNLTYKIR